MGKKGVIRSLGKCIGNIALHKFLLEKTKRKETEKHLGDEIKDYSEDAFEKSQMYIWSDKEKQEIIEKALIRVDNFKLVKSILSKDGPRYFVIEEYGGGRIREIILDVVDGLLI